MDLAFDEIDRIEALLSNYRPSSELFRISRDAGSGQSSPILKPSTSSAAPFTGAASPTAHSTSPSARCSAPGDSSSIRAESLPHAELAALRSKVGWKNVAPRPRNPYYLLHPSSADGTRPWQHRQRLCRRRRRHPAPSNRASSRPSSPPEEAPSTPSAPFPENRLAGQTFPTLCTPGNRRLHSSQRHLALHRSLHRKILHQGRPSLLPYLRSPHHAACRRYASDHRHRPQRD